MKAEYLRSLLKYSPRTGDFIWIVRKGNAVYAGAKAGCRNTFGHWKIKIDGNIYSAHRLAWLYMTDAWPKYQIDHIDGNPANNIFTNLRDVTGSVNKQNLKKAQSNNVSGFLGVNKTRGKFNAVIRIKKKLCFLGTFSTAEEAHRVYLIAKRKHHEGCTI